MRASGQEVCNLSGEVEAAIDLSRADDDPDALDRDARLLRCPLLVDDPIDFELEEHAPNRGWKELVCELWARRLHHECSIESFVTELDVLRPKELGHGR